MTDELLTMARKIESELERRNYKWKHIPPRKKRIREIVREHDGSRDIQILAVRHVLLDELARERMRTSFLRRVASSCRRRHSLRRKP